MNQLRRLAELVVGRAGLVVAVLVAVTAVLGHQAIQLEADLDVEKNYPPAHPYVQIHNAIRDQFGGDRFVVIAVVPKTGDVWNRHTLDIVRALTTDALELQIGRAHV